MLREQFDEGDVHEILKRAVSIQETEAATLQTRLAMAADELGISRESIEKAQEQWAKEKAIQRKEQLAAKKRLQEFKIHLATFVVINAFFALLNVLTWGEGKNREPWVLYILVAWGLGLAVHAITLKFPDITGQDSEESETPSGPE